MSVGIRYLALTFGMVTESHLDPPDFSCSPSQAVRQSFLP